MLNFTFRLYSQTLHNAEQYRKDKMKRKRTKIRSFNALGRITRYIVTRESSWERWFICQEYTNMRARTREGREREREREKKWLVASNCRSDDAVTNDRETTSCQYPRRDGAPLDEVRTSAHFKYSNEKRGGSSFCFRRSRVYRSVEIVRRRSHTPILLSLRKPGSLFLWHIYRSSRYIYI